MSCYSRPLRPLLHFVTGAAVLVALVGTTTIGVAGASSTAPRKALIPSITVAPANDLHKGQKVEITGKNFPHKTKLGIAECTPRVLKDDPAACATTHVVSVTTGATGSFSKTSFQVITGTVGDGSCGTTKKNLTCYIYVWEPSVPNPVDADAAILFAKPKP
ncbi:MAG: neocarzinostatin apoprotein domain-containing protein [Acidimicrobiales bacterium]